MAQTKQAKTVNNGVNVDALLAARAALTEAPQAAKFTWRASCKWNNGTHSNTAVQGFHGLGQEQKHKTEFSFSADHPEIFASEDLGATPVEYVLVGLASCLTAGVAAVAQNRGIQLRSVEAKLEGTMDIQGILGIDSDVRKSSRRAVNRSRRRAGRGGVSSSNGSRPSSSAPGTPASRRAGVSPNVRSITWCSNAVRSPIPGDANAGTRCGC
jgi:organic hydroperoxide reductase OsmC/OhrA